MRGGGSGYGWSFACWKSLVEHLPSCSLAQALRLLTVRHKCAAMGSPAAAEAAGVASQSLIGHFGVSRAGHKALASSASAISCAVVGLAFWFGALGSIASSPRDMLRTRCVGESAGTSHEVSGEFVWCPSNLLGRSYGVPSIPTLALVGCPGWGVAWDCAWKLFDHFRHLAGLDIGPRFD